FLLNCNLFVPEPNDYDDDDDDVDATEQTNPQTILKHQKYTTRLYVFLLIVSLYMLLFTGLTKRESRQMKVTPISSSIYYDLKDKYDDMLSCPCSNVTIPYEDFVNNTITFHPVCSSMFITEQWFAALYSTDASKHGVADFRTTASHQVSYFHFE
ncbi:unnamed protein product, partial [Adineta steineri]